MKRKQNKKILLLILLLTVTVGFALLSTTLQINGISRIKGNIWNIHWDSTSIRINNDSIATATGPTVSTVTTTDDTVAFEVNLELPGEFFEFTVDAVNEGTIDGYINSVTKFIYDKDDYDTNEDEATPIEPTNITFTVVYDDNGEEPEGWDLLEKCVDSTTPTRRTYKVRVEFNSTATNVPATDTTYMCVFKTTYGQNPPEAQEADFETDSWKNIIRAYNAGKTVQLQQAMENGTTREVPLDFDYDGITDRIGHIRIANLSKCENGETSQTACGLVLEFADVIFRDMMNYDWNVNLDGLGNRGGWKYSYIRAFLNGGKYNKYQVGELNFEGVSIMDALPSELKSEIIPTIVVSGYGCRSGYNSSSKTCSNPDNNGNNFVTEDYLYLLSMHEVFEDLDENPSIGPDFYDTAYYETKQLDYYKFKQVSINLKANANLDFYNGHQSVVSKKYNGDSSWWLRTPDTTSIYNFYSVSGLKPPLSAVGSSVYTVGISPAFRIAE